MPFSLFFVVFIKLYRMSLYNGLFACDIRGVLNNREKSIVCLSVLRILVFGLGSLLGLLGRMFFFDEFVATETFAGHFARFCDIHKCVGVASGDNRLDAVDLLFACHAHKHVVFFARIVADCLRYRYAAMKLDREFFCDCVGFIRDDGENKRRESAVFQKLGDF